MRVARRLARRTGPVFLPRIYTSDSSLRLRARHVRAYVPFSGPGAASSLPSYNSLTAKSTKSIPTSVDSCQDAQPRTSLVVASSPTSLLRLVENSERVSGSFEELRYQSDVTAPALRGPRLIDMPQYAHNFRLWTQFLDFRLRLDGIDGALAIWRGLLQRNIELPTTGEYATKLWSAIASVGIKHDILSEVWRYTLALAKKTDRRYEGLYEWIIGYYLRTQPTKVLPWHQKFREIKLPVAGSLSNLVDDAMHTRESLTIFERLYNESNDHTLYDRMTACLCERGRYNDALKWHRKMMKVNDLPSTASVVDPLRDYLALRGDHEVLKEVTNDLVTKGVSFAKTLPRTLNKASKISREMMSRMLGESHGVTPKVIPDRFSARMFATRAFSIDFAIAGLTSFGFDLLGPLSMRELALRCKGAEDLSARITQLGKANVQLSPCVYVQLIRRLAAEGRAGMLDAILRSDQHPDVFEDGKLQRQLLEQYIRTQDWPQVHRTLTILTAFHDEPEVEGWNILLRSYMTSGNIKLVHGLFTDMQAKKIKVTTATVQCSFFKLLRPRNSGKRPMSLTKHFDDLSFVTVMWLKIIRFGGHVPAAAWNQIHNYYGMEGRLHELERLTLWLVSFYTRQALPVSANDAAATSGFRRITLSRGRRAPNVGRTGGLKSIFGHVRQSAIISWGFKTIAWGPKKLENLRRLDALSPSANVTNLGSYETWARGVALLKAMEQRGFPIHRSTVCTAVRQRLLILFGPGRSNQLDNREAVANNTMSLRYMIRYLNGVWNDNLLGVPLALLRMEGPAADRLLYKIVLGRPADGMVGRATLSCPKVGGGKTQRSLRSGPGSGHCSMLSGQGLTQTQTLSPSKHG